MVEVITREWRDEKLPNEDIMVNPGWVWFFRKFISITLKDLLPDDDADEEGSKVCINDADKKWHDNGLENTGLETSDDRNWKLQNHVQF